MRGIPATAAGSTGFGQEFMNHLQCTRGEGRTWKYRQDIEDVIEMMHNADEGAQAIIIGKDAKSGVMAAEEIGHSFNAKTKNGKVNFVDGQIEDWADINEFWNFDVLITRQGKAGK